MLPFREHFLFDPTKAKTQKPWIFRFFDMGPGGVGGPPGGPPEPSVGLPGASGGLPGLRDLRQTKPKTPEM